MIKYGEIHKLAGMPNVGDTARNIKSFIVRNRHFDNRPVIGAVFQTISTLDTGPSFPRPSRTPSSVASLGRPVINSFMVAYLES